MSVQPPSASMLSSALLPQVQNTAAPSAGPTGHTRATDQGKSVQSLLATSSHPTSESTPSQLQQALEEVQAVIQPVARDLLFSVDTDTGKTVVKIVDSATDEVIRQMPSEELIAIAKALDKLQGLLVKQQA